MDLKQIYLFVNVSLEGGIGRFSSYRGNNVSSFNSNGSFKVPQIFLVKLYRYLLGVKISEECCINVDHQKLR